MDKTIRGIILKVNENRKEDDIDRIEQFLAEIMFRMISKGEFNYVDREEAA